jgi:TonB family protein
MFNQHADISVKWILPAIISLISILKCNSAIAIPVVENKIDSITATPSGAGYGTAFNCYIYDQKFGSNRTFLLLHTLTALSKQTPLASVNFESPTQLPQLFVPQAPAGYGKVEHISIGESVRRFKQLSKPPEDGVSNQLVVNFRVNNDGTISNLHLDKTSGDAAIDEAAMRAFSKSATFSNHPQLRGKTVDVKFTFDYDLLSTSKTSARRPAFQATMKTHAYFNQHTYTEFLDSLALQIKRAWKPLESDIDRRAVLTFSVDQNGKLSKPQIYTSSGVATFDQAAINAVKHAGIVPTPPKSLGNTVNVQFTFDRNLTLLKEPK